MNDDIVYDNISIWDSTSDDIIDISTMDGAASIYISTGGERKSINLFELVDRIDVIEKRLLILRPDVTMMEQYPVLQGLYDDYKAAEALLSKGNNYD
jgi:hypothetical protein